MNKEQFNELVWDFGANGIENPSLCNEEQWQIVARCWYDVEKCEKYGETDREVTDRWFEDFCNAK